jgi:hypothetical protein
MPLPPIPQGLKQWVRVCCLGNPNVQQFARDVVHLSTQL